MKVSKLAKLWAASVLVAGAGLAVAQGIEERVKPVGEVCMAGQPCAATQVAQAGAEARSPQAVYDSGCAVCHAAGVAGAPKFGDTAAWQAKLEQKGLQALRDNAVNGINAMPAKGLCTNCSAEEVHGAVDYILKGSNIEV